MSQDSRAIVLEGVLAGEKGQFDCPILLKVFGPAEPVARAECKSSLIFVTAGFAEYCRPLPTALILRILVEARLKADRMPLKPRSETAPKKPKESVAAPKRSQMGYQSSQGSSQSEPMSQPEPTIQNFVENSERFRPRDIEKLAQEWGAPEDMLSKMPKADQPESLQSTLLPYQRQGLKWMLEKENPILPDPNSDHVVQLWKRQKKGSNLFQNIATNYSQQSPVLAKGGILADDMGLGKTLQVISLILEGGPGTTLIVAPVSVMSNWAQQMERHIKKENALKVLTYHGSGRKAMTHREFGEYDVVITTYGTLTAELFTRGVKSPKKVPTKEGLFSTNWARIVLDEGHIIRNPATKAAIAATSILATARWVLTGTPIVNTIKDFYSMLKFLKITGGLEQLELFNAIFTRRLYVYFPSGDVVSMPSTSHIWNVSTNHVDRAIGDRDAEILLQTTMRTLCLRRKKDMKFVDLKLPELSEYVHRIQFRADEKEKYEALQ